MAMQLTDAHSHLQDERLSPQLEAVIKEALNAGVTRIVCCGTEEEDWAKVLGLKERYPKTVIASFGLHPWYAGSRSGQWLKRLAGCLASVPSGVGEIGLDFALDEFDPKDQEEVFRSQLELAVRLKRPVSLHCRKAWDALLRILREYGPLEAGGLVHSYSGAAELIPGLNSLGLCISFSGSITRSGNKRGQRALVAVPDRYLLVETDSPDILPAGVQGLNEPAHLVLVVKAVASLRGVDEKEIARVTFENAERIFRGEVCQD